MQREPDPQRERDARPSSRPGSLVPRWLAWLVLVLLLAASVFSVCSLLDTGSRAEGQAPGPGAQSGGVTQSRVSPS